MATILIVDDDASLTYYWRQVLETQKHSVYCFTEIDLAFDVIRELLPDVIILDMMFQQGDQFLPEGGLTLLARLRLEYVGSSSIIGVSGFRPGIYSQSSALEIAKATGLDAALYKPVSPGQLSRTVDQLLARANIKPVSFNVLSAS